MKMSNLPHILLRIPFLKIYVLHLFINSFFDTVSPVAFDQYG